MLLDLSMMVLTLFFIGAALYAGLRRIRSHGDYFFGIIVPLAILGLGLIVRTMAGLYFSPLPLSLFVVPQYLAWCAFLFLPLFLIGISWIERNSKTGLAIVSAVGAMGVLFTAYYAFLVEPYNLEITQHTIYSEKITESMRIGVLADIQTDNPGDYERRVFAELAEQKPDLVLMAGDYIQVYDRDQYWALLDELLDMMADAGLPSTTPSLPFRVTKSISQVGRAEWRVILNSLSPQGMGKRTCSQILVSPHSRSARRPTAT